nr:MAG TPA: hypothetical protein [Caudoviricetes sp.]
MLQKCNRKKFQKCDFFVDKHFLSCYTLFIKSHKCDKIERRKYGKCS